MPLAVLQSLEQLYENGFHDPVTDMALRKVAQSQFRRDQMVLRDLEADLARFERRYGYSSADFFRRWQAGEMPDTADFMDWNALFQMTQEIRHRLSLLESVAPAQ